MPVTHAIWTVGDAPERLHLSQMPSEHLLEDMIVRDSRILSDDWMLIGRQETTKHGGRVDLLAIQPDGSLVLIELKRDQTPQTVVAQALDYATWVARLTTDQISQIFERFADGRTLDDAFRERFGFELDEETVNESHQIVIVAAELDESTERIVGYLSERDISINVMFFQVFQQDDQKFLSRTWLIDPDEVQPATVNSTTSGPWNGEFYANYGGNRDWEDARKYGFISAGGGSFYSRSLQRLSTGNRVWVNTPKKGYVGVGHVTQPRRPIRELLVPTPDGEFPALEVLTDAEMYRSWEGSPETSEYYVGVKWLDTVSESEAVSEVGLFGNQNTVAAPRTPKWEHTIERLKKSFPNWAG